jgi:hypothetical protein
MSERIGTCESCGSDDESVVTVRRIYVTPEAWDTAASVALADVESWCFVCRTHYPHHELDEDGNRIDDELSWPDASGSGTAPS